MTWKSIAFIALLTSCGRQTTVPGDSSTSPVVDPVTQFRLDAEANGHTIRDGVLFFSTFDGCCDDGANCLGNNPGTPYGTYALPRLPDEAEARDYFAVWGELPDPNLTRAYRLRHDEALVYIGTTPPAANYIGLQSYLVQRPTAQGGYVGIVGSVGPVVNSVTIAADLDTTPDQIWDRPFILVTTADLAVETRIHSALVSAGFDSADIHHDRISYDRVQMGVGPEGDTFGHVWRVAVEHDEVAGQAFRDDPGGVLLRVTPDAEQPIQNPHIRPVALERGAGTDETAWQPALDALDQAIRERHSGMRAVDVWTSNNGPREFDCIEEEVLCNADTPDRLTWLTPFFQLDSSDDFVVAYGVNHEHTGKASYSSFVVIEEDHQIGFAGVNSREMPGSAAHYVPNEPLVDDLYAYTVSRDCSQHAEPCVEIPGTCPGAPVGDRIRLTMRAYLEQATGTGPDMAEMVGDRVIAFRAP